MDIAKRSYLENDNLTNPLTKNDFGDSLPSSLKYLEFNKTPNSEHRISPSGAIHGDYISQTIWLGNVVKLCC